jgi:hypothetical protein
MRRKLGGIEGGSLLATALKVSLASAFMGLVCWFASRQMEARLGTQSTPSRILLVSASIGIGIVVFYLAARLLRIGELDQIAAKFRQKFGKRKS